MNGGVEKEAFEAARNKGKPHLLSHTGLIIVKRFLKVTRKGSSDAESRVALSICTAPVSEYKNVWPKRYFSYDYSMLAHLLSL